MANEIDDKLVGMKEIAQHIRMSESQALKLYRNCGLPIRKAEGIWIGSRTKLNEWFKGRDN